MCDITHCEWSTNRSTIRPTDETRIEMTTCDDNGEREWTRTRSMVQPTYETELIMTFWNIFGTAQRVGDWT